MLTSCLAVALSAAEVSAVADAPAPKPTLFFLGFQAGAGVSAEAAKGLTESMQTELAALGAYRVLSQSDLATMLGIERQRQLLGCSEAASDCMAELAGALNSNRAIIGTVTREDADVHLNVSLIDPQHAQALARVGRKVEAGTSLAPVYEQLRPLLYELVNQDPLFKDHPFSAPRGFGGFTLGVRGEFEALLPSGSPVVFAEYAWRYLGLLLGIVATNNPAVRLEVRFFPFTLWKLRPHVGAGATAFLTGVALRGVVGATLGIDHLQFVLDFAFEHFFARPGHIDNAVLAALGVGWAI